MLNRDIQFDIRLNRLTKQSSPNDTLELVRNLVEESNDNVYHIKSVVFDIGGVLAKTSKKRFLRMVIHNDLKYVKMLPIIDAYWKEYRNGFLSENEFWYKILSKTPLVEHLKHSTSNCRLVRKIKRGYKKGTINVRKTIKLLKREYRQKFIIFRKIFPILKYLKKKKKMSLGIISNHSSKWVKHLWKLSNGTLSDEYDRVMNINSSKQSTLHKMKPFSKYFDKDLTIISEDVGISKPNPKIFHLYMSRITSIVGDIRPEEILYIDDKKRNVKMARKLRWNAIRFNSEIDCVKKFRKQIDYYVNKK